MCHSRLLPDHGMTAASCACSVPQLARVPRLLLAFRSAPRPQPFRHKVPASARGSGRRMQRRADISLTGTLGRCCPACSLAAEAGPLSRGAVGHLVPCQRAAVMACSGAWSSQRWEPANKLEDSVTGLQHLTNVSNQPSIKNQGSGLRQRQVRASHHVCTEEVDNQTYMVLGNLARWGGWGRPSHGDLVQVACIRKSLGMLP